MSQFLDVFRFELAFRRRHAPLYIFTGICFLVAFLSMAIEGGMDPFGGTGTIAINAPVAVQRLMLVFCLLLGLVITTAFVAASVIRDDEYGAQHLFLSTPLRKGPYLFGRFGGSLLAAWFMISGIALGALLGSVMPWHDPERVVALTLTPYLYSLGVFMFPNLLFVGALAFSVATLSRRMMYAYIAVLGLLVIYIVSGNYIGDLENDFIAAISDPFGLRTYALATRYWTPAEANSIAAPFTKEIVINRILWSGVGVAVLVLTFLRYRMEVHEGGGKTRPEADAPVGQSAVAEPLPAVHPRFDLRTNLAQLWFQLRTEVRGLVRSAPFIVIALFGVGNIVGVSFGQIQQGGTTTLPVTQIMLTVIQGGMALFMLIVLVFYAGELIHRERRFKVAEFYDALPIPNWVPLLAKLGAMVVGMVVLMLVATATTVTFQLAKGYPRLELGLYLQDLAAMQVILWVILSVAAVVAQVFTNHKFLGYLVMVMLFIVQAALPALDLEHNLYNYGSFPGVTYSDMNGYGHFAAAQAAFALYWGAFAALLVALAELMWPRGTDSGLRQRLANARARLNRPRTLVLAATGLAWLGSGAFIFYNTNVLNDYVPSDVVEDRQVRYEQTYKQYEGLPQPRITDVAVEADLYPEARHVEVRGTLHVVNKNDVPIESIHVSLDPSVEVAALEIPGASLETKDEEIGYRIYTLAEPMQPGAEMDVRWDFRKHLRGFGNQSADNSIVRNGTFFNSFSYMPHFGYQPGGELADPNTRRDKGLPERPRMAKIDDMEARGNTYLSTDSDWVTFKATVSTSPEQIAVAPGYLQREWTEDGRRYFAYEMDSKILNFWSVLSADYQVKRDAWQPKGGGEPVAIEIFYDEAHPYNVDKMILAIKESLDYFTANFSDYQHQQVRILEFPKYASFAQSFPNTIPYSESIGFIADASDPEDIDYVHYVTAHEVAHQWWAHQVIGANVQGATLMSETLAQYSALMVMEKHYGPEKMPKFLKYELNRYLSARGGETIGEMPLLLVENQQYIHYRKGSLILFALKEYLGEDAVNRALRDYIAEVAFQDPPYTVSTDLYAHFKRVAPDKYAYLLEDMFEKITLYDNRAKSATVVERDDGKFDVTLEYQAKKFYADAKGTETEAEALDDWIEIGIYVERETEEGPPKDDPLYLQLHRLDGTQSTLTITVDERPTHAGIDPRNLLIDREPDDNRKKIEDAA